MKVNQNIGIINALIRITLGLTVVAFSTAKLTRRPWKNSYLLLAMLGAMKVGEGILRYCPLTAMFEGGMNMGSFMGKGEGKDNGYRSQGGQHDEHKGHDAKNKSSASPNMDAGMEAVMNSFKNELGEDAPKVHHQNQRQQQGGNKGYQEEFSPELNAVVKSFEKKVDDAVSKNNGNGNGGQNHR